MWLSPMMDVKSSGAELPAAMNVAPATSSLRWRRCEKLAQEEQKEDIHCRNQQICSEKDLQSDKSS